MRKIDKLKNIHDANLLSEQRYLESKGFINENIISEETIDDFYNFIETDPRKCTYASLQYMHIYNTGLSKPKNNPFYNKFIKITNFQFKWGSTYKDVVTRTNPDWEFQKRKGEYEKIQGYSVLERDANGDEVLPITNPSVLGESIIIVLDENNNEKERFPSKELKERYGEHFQNSAFKPKVYASGSAQLPLKVKSILKIKAGGKEWTNPHHNLKNLNLNVDLPRGQKC